MKRFQTQRQSGFEPLGQRQLLAVLAEFRDGELEIHGDHHANRIQVTATDSGILQVLVDDRSHPIRATAARLEPLDAAQVHQITVWGHGGADQVDLRVAPEAFVRLTGTRVVSGKPDLPVGSDPVIVFGAFARNSMIGSKSDDRLIGGAASDHIVGYGGRDEIDGLGGADRLHGGIPFLDYVFPRYADEGDVIHGGDGADLIYGGPGDDLLYGGPGKDTILGEQGRDTIRGGLHADHIQGGTEDDVLYGDFRDRKDAGYFPFGGADQIYGGSGADTIRGGPGNDRIWAGAGNDQAFGDAGCDVIDGGSGFANVLRGGTGDDLLSQALLPNSQGDSGVDRVNGRLEDPPGTLSEGCAFGIEVNVMPTHRATSEWGSTATLNVRLLSPPTADVVISGIHSADQSEGTVLHPFSTQTITLTFTPENWSTFQQVTVVGQSDQVDDGDARYAIMIPAAVSRDPNYDGRLWDFQHDDYRFSITHATVEHSAVCLVNLDQDADAVDDQAKTVQNVPVRIDVLANDRDQDSKNELVIERWTQPVALENPSVERGTVRAVGKQLEYMPPPDFVGKVQFHYEARGSVVTVTDQATVTIDVQAGQSTLTNGDAPEGTDAPDVTPRLSPQLPPSLPADSFQKASRYDPATAAMRWAPPPTELETLTRLGLWELPSLTRQLQGLESAIAENITGWPWLGPVVETEARTTEHSTVQLVTATTDLLASTELQTHEALGATSLTSHVSFLRSLPASMSSLMASTALQVLAGQEGGVDEFWAKLVDRVFEGMT